MQRFTLDRSITGAFNEQQRKLICSQEELQTFIDLPFSKENLIKQADRKSDWYSQEARSLLVQELRKSYSSAALTKEQDENLKRLEDHKTVTITTGHQLSLFTGPLYFVYKILHVVDLCEKMNASDEEHSYVPVFWLASEDHDFEEISSIELFGKELNLEYNGNDSVGRISSEILTPVLNQFSEFFRIENKKEIEGIIEAYGSGKSLGESTFQMINRLFGKYGLIVLDGDNRSFKSSFSNIIEKEIESGISHREIEKTNHLLGSEGLKIQAHSREINMFTLFNRNRARVIHTDKGFYIEGVGEADLAKVKELIAETPEQFSPNALIRPVYQEFILPNVCYVGGVGELSYWLQIKGVFEAYGVPYPLIQVRNSLLWIDLSTSNKMMKYDLHIEDVFMDIDQIKREYIEENEKEGLDLSEIESLNEQLIVSLKNKVLEIDASLDGYVTGETVRMQKQIQGIREKLMKNMKQKHDAAMLSIDQVKHKLFPSGELQERNLNFFNLTPNGNVSEKIDQIKSMIDAFENELIIVRE